jgi:hypothetical protein
MSGYPIIFGEGVDPDAYQYFLRAGIESGTQTPSSYDNAASFNGTNQFLSIASNSTLTVTGSSFTFAFWANTPNTSAGMVISKSSGSDTREFQIVLNTGGALGFTLFPNGTFAGRKDLNSGASAFIANTWNLFVCQYDSSAATIGISVNGGAFTSLGSIPAITQTNTNPLNFGVFLNTSTGLNYTGQLSSIGFWKRALTASEVTQLWNSGVGRTYASLDSGLRTNLVSWWALNQNSVTADSHGTNTLTNNGTPLVTATTLGPIVTTTQNSRQLINSFVKGIKSLGLWNSMVCWPLRSSQNAGSGLTAFSLGGLGNFDGTLVSSGALPTWGANGITNSATGIITTGLSVPSIPTHNMVVVNQSATGGSQSYYSDLSNANTRGTRAQSVNLIVSNGSGFVFTPYSAPDVNVFKALNYDVTSTLGRVNLNGNSTNLATLTLSALPPASSLTMAMMAAAVGDQPMAGTMAFYMNLSTSLTTTQVPQVYSLYKQTLGLGLGLP